jgi:hypothetical protein
MHRILSQLLANKARGFIGTASAFIVGNLRVAAQGPGTIDSLAVFPLTRGDNPLRGDAMLNPIVE